MEQVMNQKDVKVSFYLKKSEADASGNCPVMARLIVGKHSETAFSVKLRVHNHYGHPDERVGKVLRPGKLTTDWMKYVRLHLASIQNSLQSVSR